MLHVCCLSSLPTACSALVATHTTYTVSVVCSAPPARVAPVVSVAAVAFAQALHVLWLHVPYPCGQCCHSASCGYCVCRSNNQLLLILQWSLQPACSILLSDLKTICRALARGVLDPELNPEQHPLLCLKRFTFLQSLGDI